MMPNKRICACANPDCPTVGVYEPDSACPLCGMRMLFAPGIEMNDVIASAATDFVSNVENRLIEGAGEMPLRCDESYRALRDAVKQSPVDLNGGGRFA